MSEKTPATPTQTVYIVLTAAIFLVVGIMIATFLNRDSVSQDDLKNSVNHAVGTSVALSAAQQPDYQPLIDAAVATQIAANAPVATASGAGSTLTQGELQALVNQAVGTQVAALKPTNTPVPPTPTVIPADVSADDDPFLGPADAPVVIVEFSDFQCGYCNRWAQQVLPKILETYPNEVKFVYRDFTIFGDDSIRAAMAAHCAEESGKFWDMHNYLFNGLASEPRIGLDEDSLVSAAGDMGLDESSFRECVASQRYLAEIIDDGRTAQSWGFGGTPGFVINGVVYPFGAQSFEVFDSIIKAELEAAAS